MTKKLTHEEFARMGAIATNSKYSKEQKAEWGRKAKDALIKKYGPNYYKDLAKKSVKARKLRKAQNEAKSSK